MFGNRLNTSSRRRNNGQGSSSEGVVFRMLEEIFALNLEGKYEGAEIETEISSFQIYFQSLYDLYDNKVS